jgi:hypothetical protein
MTIQVSGSLEVIVIFLQYFEMIIVTTIESKFWGDSYQILCSISSARLVLGSKSLRGTITPLTYTIGTGSLEYPLTYLVGLIQSSYFFPQYASALFILASNQCSRAIWYGTSLLRTCDKTLEMLTK